MTISAQFLKSKPSSSTDNKLYSCVEEIMLKVEKLEIVAIPITLAVSFFTF